MGIFLARVNAQKIELSCLSAYPNDPAARKAIKPQTKWRNADISLKLWQGEDEQFDEVRDRNVLIETSTTSLKAIPQINNTYRSLDQATNKPADECETPCEYCGPKAK
jgi:beta-phosphoglucomutase-like phosphatase (HAD superfamily)